MKHFNVDTGSRARRLAGALVLGLILAAPGGGLATAADGDEPSAGDIRKETGELMQALKAYGADKRDEAVEQTQAALDNIDRRIEALEANMLENWDKMDQAARDRSRASLNALRAQRTEVAEWFGGLKNSSVSAWGHLKQGFSDAYRAMSHAWEKSEKDVGTDDK